MARAQGSCAPLVSRAVPRPAERAAPQALVSLDSVERAAAEAVAVSEQALRSVENRVEELQRVLWAVDDARRGVIHAPEPTVPPQRFG